MQLPTEHTPENALGVKYKVYLNTKYNFTQIRKNETVIVMYITWGETYTNPRRQCCEYERPRMHFITSRDKRFILYRNALHDRKPPDDLSL